MKGCKKNVNLKNHLIYQKKMFYQNTNFSLNEMKWNLLIINFYNNVIK